jgi:hypothetical protein
MNPDGNRFQPRPRPAGDMRPSNGHGHPGNPSQPRPNYPGNNRGFRNRPNAPRFGSQPQETPLSRTTTRNSEGESKPGNETGLGRLVNFHKEEQTIRNDLALRYATSGEWGGNHIKGTEPEESCKEYVCSSTYARLFLTAFNQISQAPPSDRNEEGPSPQTYSSRPTHAIQRPNRPPDVSYHASPNTLRRHPNRSTTIIRLV